MNEVVIMRGPSGCGKSTWRKKNRPDAYVCSADFFWYNERSVREQALPLEESPYPIVYKDNDPTPYNYIFNYEYIADSHKDCRNHYIKALEDKRPRIVVDNTFTLKAHYYPYEKTAQMAGYKVTIIEFRVKTVEEIKMLAKRNTHGVPLSAIAGMACEFEPCFHATVIEIGK